MKLPFSPRPLKAIDAVLEKAGDQLLPIGWLRLPEGDSRIARQFTAGFE